MFRKRWSCTCACLISAAGILVQASMALGAAAPTSIPQLALYQGADREKILIEGAKREGQLTFSIRTKSIPSKNWKANFPNGRV